MLSTLRDKIRDAIQDNEQSDTEAFTAGSGDTFTIAQENVSEVTSITVGGNALESGDYDYDSTSQIVTIESGGVSSGDAVVIYFTYNKYSDTELNSYINRALMEMDANNYHPHFDVTGTDLFPIPTPREQNLIAMICKIIINPNWSEYRTATVTIRYPRTLNKDDKIRKLVAWFKLSMGIVGTIDL